MKILSWNVNGIRSVQRKGALDWIWNSDLDIVCFQETKAQPEQLDEALTAPEGWTAQFASAEKKGYSGVVTFVRDGVPFKKAQAGLGIERFDSEGRVMITDHDEFLLYNVYFPNGKAREERLAYKMDFYREIQKKMDGRVRRGKRIVVCGDVNTAHRPIDLARPRENEKISGFLPEEREWIDGLIAKGWVDSFRAVHGDVPESYSWWSMRSGARARNIGWRIDYFYLSKNLKDALVDAWISPELMGSDHCPLGIELKL
jgi:exodeoxyribonuclease III